MQNALKPGTAMPIHRHHGSSETVVILWGNIHPASHDDTGIETERVVLDADGDLRMPNVEKDRQHSLECLESDSALYERKDRPYQTEEEERRGKREEKEEEGYQIARVLDVDVREPLRGIK